MQRFEGTCQLSTWLHRIVVNMALMRLRTRRRKPEEQMEALLPSFQEDGHHVEQFSEWAMPADRLLEREDVRATVRSCIAQLPESYRQVLLLRDIEELPTDQVATDARCDTDGHQGQAAPRTPGALDIASPGVGAMTCREFADFSTAICPANCRRPCWPRSSTTSGCASTACGISSSIVSRSRLGVARSNRRVRRCLLTCRRI